MTPVERASLLEKAARCRRLAAEQIDIARAREARGDDSSSARGSASYYLTEAAALEALTAADPPTA